MGAQGLPPPVPYSKNHTYTVGWYRGNVLVQNCGWVRETTVEYKWEIKEPMGSGGHPMTGQA